MKTSTYFITSFIAILATYLFAGAAIAENFTLSDEGLMTLHKGSYYSGATASVVSKSDVTGPGVEFEIYFPGIKVSDTVLEMVCARGEANEPLVGADVGRFDNYELKFTLISIDGKKPVDNRSGLGVGALIGCDNGPCGYRPERIGFGEFLEPNAVSSTIVEGGILARIGFHINFLNPIGWNPDGTTVKILVEPVSGDIQLPERIPQRVQPPRGKVICVDANASGNNDGSNWANAFKYLSEAMEVAVKGDQIWVAKGFYRPNDGKKTSADNRRATFLLKTGVAIYGGFPTGGSRWEDSNPALNETILSGDLGGDDMEVNNPRQLLTDSSRKDNTTHVVTASGTDETAILDGFTVMAGNASGDKGIPSNQGGGLYCKSGSPTISNCIFRLNSAENGGAIYFWQGTPKLTNCKFIDNYAGDSGGGIHSAESNLTLVNCVFTRNSAVEKGGGIYNENCKPTIINCTVTKNYSYAGGGIYNYKSTPTLTNCLLWGNTSRYGADEPAQVYGVKIISRHCCIQGLTAELGGTANISKDPVLADIEKDGYRLSANSPCINAGDSDAIPDETTADVDGNPRIAGLSVDIGAAEYAR